jgi:hypothetical protein
MGDTWCITCEQRAREDVTGLGDFAQHAAERHNRSLQQVGISHVLPSIPVLKSSSGKRIMGVVPQVSFLQGLHEAVPC